MELPKSLSAILFYQAEPMAIKRLAGLSGQIADRGRNRLIAVFFQIV